jgi:hypothetical protein
VVAVGVAKTLVAGGTRLHFFGEVKADAGDGISAPKFFIRILFNSGIRTERTTQVKRLQISIVMQHPNFR